MKCLSTLLRLSYPTITGFIRNLGVCNSELIILYYHEAITYTSELILPLIHPSSNYETRYGEVIIALINI